MMIVTTPDYMNDFKLPVNQSKLTKFLSVFFLIRKKSYRMINNYSGILAFV